MKQKKERNVSGNIGKKKMKNQKSKVKINISDISKDEKKLVKAISSSLKNGDYKRTQELADKLAQIQEEVAHSSGVSADRDIYIISQRCCNSCGEFGILEFVEGNPHRVEQCPVCNSHDLYSKHYMPLHCVKKLIADYVMKNQEFQIEVVQNIILHKIELVVCSMLSMRQHEWYIDESVTSKKELDVMFKMIHKKSKEDIVEC